MFGSNFDFQSTQSQPQLESFAEYPFSLDSTNKVANCQHRDLQEILDCGESTTAMKNTSQGQKLQPTSLIICETDVDKLRKYSPTRS
jgi:hypothetical protein